MKVKILLWRMWYHRWFCYETCSRLELIGLTLIVIHSFIFQGGVLPQYSNLSIALLDTDDNQGSCSSTTDSNPTVCQQVYVNITAYNFNNLNTKVVDVHDYYKNCLFFSSLWCYNLFHSLVASHWIRTKRS